MVKAGKKRIFSDEEMASIMELAEVLRDIRKRLISEGWTIKDGVFTTPEGISYTKETAAQYAADKRKKAKGGVQSTKHGRGG